MSSFPCWPGLITVDPVSGSYSDEIGGKKVSDHLLELKNLFRIIDSLSILLFQVFHFQYFGHTPYRGFTDGKVWKYEGREKYEQKLEQMKAEVKSNKNLKTPEITKLRKEIADLEIKKTKNDWAVACEQADESMSLSRADRIKTLTFEYIGPKSRAVEEDSDEEERPAKSKPSTPKPKPRKSTGDLKRSVSKASGLKTPASKRKKKTVASSPTDVYDFNDASSDEDEQPAKFELSSAKRAKGEFAFYERQMRESVEKENPKLDRDEITTKLRRNWDLMSEDMRNSYAPRSSQFTNQQNGKEEATPQKTRKGSLKKSLPIFTTDDEPETPQNGDAEPEKNPASVVSSRASRYSARFKTPSKVESTVAPASSSSSENHKKEESPASTTVTNNSTNNFKSNSIKSKSSTSNHVDENGVSEDSLSCSSEEKTEQQKEQLCGKCGKLDKGLIACEG